jgi:hypothetical protein
MAMDKKKDSMAGMTSAQKAAVLKGKQRSNKDEMAKLDPSRIQYGFGPFGYADKVKKTGEMQKKKNQLAQGNVDMGRTIGRLESSDARKKTSARYRAKSAALAKMKKGKKK